MNKKIKPLNIAIYLIILFLITSGCTKNLSSNADSISDIEMLKKIAEAGQIITSNDSTTIKTTSLLKSNSTVMLNDAPDEDGWFKSEGPVDSTIFDEEFYLIQQYRFLDYDGQPITQVGTFDCEREEIIKKATYTDYVLESQFFDKKIYESTDTKFIETEESSGNAKISYNNGITIVFNNIIYWSKETSALNSIYYEYRDSERTLTREYSYPFEITSDGKTYTGTFNYSITTTAIDFSELYASIELNANIYRDNEKIGRIILKDDANVEIYDADGVLIEL
jgi:hypothetical protein